MKYISKIIFYLFCCFFAMPGEVYAFGGTQTGKITAIIIRQADGLIYFFMNGQIISPAACNVGGYFMIRDENSATGKRQYAMLLAARLSGQVITVTGAGTCTRWRDGEDLERIEM